MITIRITVTTTPQQCYKRQFDESLISKTQCSLVNSVSLLYSIIHLKQNTSHIARHFNHQVGQLQVYTAGLYYWNFRKLFLEFDCDDILNLPIKNQVHITLPQMAPEITMESIQIILHSPFGRPGNYPEYSTAIKEGHINVLLLCKSR